HSIPLPPISTLIHYTTLFRSIFEHTELFTLKSGPNVVEEIYAFQDKGGREIALRPELTAPVMRFFVNELSSSPRPLKMFYFGPRSEEHTSELQSREKLVCRLL